MSLHFTYIESISQKQSYHVLTASTNCFKMKFSPMWCGTSFIRDIKMQIFKWSKIAYAQVKRGNFDMYEFDGFQYFQMSNFKPEQLKRWNDTQHYQAAVIFVHLSVDSESSLLRAPLYSSTALLILFVFAALFTDAFWSLLIIRCSKLFFFSPLSLFFLTEWIHGPLVWKPWP